jgi:hypothetical protein
VVVADPKSTTGESKDGAGLPDGTWNKGGEAARNAFTTCMRLHDGKRVWIRGGKVSGYGGYGG